MRHENVMQQELAGLLARRLGPGVWWTAVDEGGMRKPWIAVQRRRRGCRAGTPDLLVLWRGRLIGIELKSPAGIISEAQRVMREEIVMAGGRWFACRSIEAVLEVLRRLRVPLLPVSRLEELRAEMNGTAGEYAFDPMNPLHYPQEDLTRRRVTRQELVAAERRRHRRRMAMQKQRRRAAKRVGVKAGSTWLRAA